MSKIMMFSHAPRIILASRSPYRRALLRQIHLEHDAQPADLDESALPGELPADTATRLAHEKARAVAPRYPDALIIGSDQVCALEDGTALGKPGNHEAAVRQLTQMSGRRVLFHTAACLLNARTGRARHASVPTEVQYRTLSRDTIEAYLNSDKPYDCAGSAKIESLGIALVERVSSDDPSALIGLPLIALIGLLADEGVRVI
jgi:septum formation protein